MRPWLTFLLAVTLAVALAEGLNRLPDVLARLEVFRVTDVDYTGGRYLTEAEAEATLGLRPEASVWDDPGLWEERLLNHPLVEEAKVRRRFPGTLVLEITEKEPVALYPNPTLEPVDAAGRLLPIDPARHRLDLPLMNPGMAEDHASLTPAQRRLLAEEIARIQAGDPEFLGRISEIALGRGGEMTASVWDPPFTLHFRAGLSSQRIREGLRVLRDAAGRFPEAAVVDLDLRYDDQVVIRMNQVEGN